MKKLKTKNLIKQIICIIIVLMLCNFIMPNYTYAVDTAEGGSLMEVIAQFLCFIPDAVIDIMQDMFVAHERIELDDETYSIKYSPGIIFSGQLPALDINFISPGGNKKNTDYNNFLMQEVDTFYENKVALGGLGEYIQEIEEAEINSDYKQITAVKDNKYKYNIYYNTDEENRLTVNVLFVEFVNDNEYEYHKYENTYEPNDEIFDIYEYESTAGILQPIVATWYKALRRIALVGLLSAIVYIGIRIVLSSTSAKDKAKYKSMLKDWLIAICLLFTFCCGLY